MTDTITDLADALQYATRHAAQHGLALALCVLAERGYTLVDDEHERVDVNDITDRILTATENALYAPAAPSPRIPVVVVSARPDPAASDAHSAEQDAGQAGGRDALTAVLTAIGAHRPVPIGPRTPDALRCEACTQARSVLVGWPCVPVSSVAALMGVAVDVV